MSNHETVRELLKNHRINKARIGFIENQIKRIELGNQFYSEMYSNKCLRETDNTEYITNTAVLFGSNSVMEVECEYDKSFAGTHGKMMDTLKKEFEQRRFLSDLLEDALEVLGDMDGRYRTIIEDFYVKSCRMEDIAEGMHISRSKCYELSKEAIDLLEKVILGNGTSIRIENKEHVYCVI